MVKATKRARKFNAKVGTGSDASTKKKSLLSKKNKSKRPTKSQSDIKAESKAIHDEEIAKYFLDKYNEKIDVTKTLKWYARLRLGEQIKNCVQEKGHCYFRAEL